MSGEGIIFSNNMYALLSSTLTLPSCPKLPCNVLERAKSGQQLNPDKACREKQTTVKPIKNSSGSTLFAFVRFKPSLPDM